LGQPKFYAWSASLTAFINLICVYPMIKKWGIHGAAAALFFSASAIPIFIGLVNKKVIRIGNMFYLRTVYGPAALLNLFFLAVFFRLNPLISSPASFAWILLLSLASLATIDYFFLAEPDRTFLNEKIKRLFLGN